MKKAITFIFFISILPNQILFGTASLMSYVKISLMGLILWYYRGHKKTFIPTSITGLGYFHAISTIILLGILRDNNPAGSIAFSVFRVAYYLVYFLTLGTIFFDYYKQKSDNFSLMVFRTVIMPAYLYYALNIVLWIFKFPPLFKVLAEDTLGDTVFLSLIGIHLERVLLPLAPGFNDYAAQVALTMCLSIAFLYVKKLPFSKVYLLIGMGICLISILLTDSRISFITPIIVIAFLTVPYRFVKKAMLYCAMFVLLFGQFLMLYVLPQYSSSLSSVSRTSNDISQNGRFIIWNYVISELSDFKIEHLFGYGEYGHFGSGVSLHWASLLKGYVDSKLKTPHNTFFSIILDYGYIGLIVYILLFIKLISLTNKDFLYNTPIYKVTAALILVNACNGVTETMFGFYCQNFVLTMLSVMLLVFLSVYTLKIDLKAIKSLFMLNKNTNEKPHQI